MFAVGDIIEMYSPVAGKKKYQLCVCAANAAGQTKFLFLNSGQGYSGNYAVTDDKIPCLPASPTGFSVFSCSLVLKYTDRELKLYNAAKLGELDKAVAAGLEAFIRKTPVLPKKQREEIADCLKAIS